VFEKRKNSVRNPCEWQCHALTVIMNQKWIRRRWSDSEPRGVAAMSMPLLKTKLYIPPIRHELVPRPRLIDRLNAGLDRKLTLISAPAGYGKTTLLSEWIAGYRKLEAQVRFAWVSLDEGDNDASCFLTYAVSALQTVEEDSGAAILAALAMPQPPPIEALFTDLINETTAIPGRCVLVLDDYHVIHAQAVHDALSFLLERLPPNIHLVIATRADPPLPISRLRGRGELIELRQADLSFTPDEVNAYLKTAVSLDLADDTIASLTARTEGWITGLQMAALSMRERDDIAGFIAAFSGSHEYIADYLSDEVLSQQPESVRIFLLQTSILDRLTGPLCEAVTGQARGQQTLEELKEGNLFVVSLDDERRWYRYHHLFASLLQQRLGRSQPEIGPELHRRASVWYEQNGFVADAIQHALVAGDLDRGERLVAENALTMIYGGRLVTLVGWLEAVPPGVLHSRPWLSVAYAWALGFAGEPGRIEPLLRDAEEALGTVDGRIERQHITGHIATIRAYRSMQRREIARAAGLVREALQYLPEDDLLARSFATDLAGNVHRMSGNLVAAAQTMSEALALAEAANATYLAVDVRCDLAKIQIAQGQLRMAAATCRRALRLTEGPVGRRGSPMPIKGQACAWLSLVLCEQNDLDAALEHATDGLRICRRWGQKAYLGIAYIALAQTLQATGDADGALGAIEQAKQAASDLAASVAALVSAQEMQIRFVQGDTAAVWRYANAIARRIDGELVFHRSDEYRVLAQALIAQGELDHALELLARLYESAQAAGAMGRSIGVRVLQAMALQAKGETDQALAALQHALVPAEPEGYVRTFVDQGAPMGRLLRMARDRGIAADYVSRLLGILDGEIKKERVAPKLPRPSSTAGASSSVLAVPRRFEGSAGEALIEPLSEREIEVLRLLATHLSRREIAAELCISVNTVRFHTKNIYSKLGVHRRSDAVLRSRELRLL
jgi:LuxR family maltose regulon positive regulatory protein